ncbi:MAG: tRNA pseudouridine(55) synthase TruB [bacterium]|nr:tRNA pseudouridine(55) synthase TruB [bacterium]
MIFAIYKPKGPTSNFIVQKIKKITGIKKVGHAGTLDPLAKGVLVIGVGRASTKKLSQVVAKEKEYLATIKLGLKSTTDDEEGIKEKITVLERPNKKDIQKVIKKFEGEILQVPPIYSAIKIKGKEAYKLARKGQEVQLKPRKVKVKKITLQDYKWPYFKIRVVTGPGVYIRSLARDIGQNLKTGGYLSNLERTRVGKFNRDNALNFTQVKKLASRVKGV